MKLDFRLLLLLYVFISTPTVSIDAAQPKQKIPVKLLRLVIVDNSGSMSGERIAVVRSELLKLARQLPPSPEYPFALVTFASNAGPAQHFIDRKSFETALKKLDGNGGGTNIASGLRQGRRTLEYYRSAANVWLLLYSDGQDSDQKSIFAEEAKLDALFAQRQKQGLPQSVFCKRWGNANATLISRIRKRGRATVIDLADFNIHPLTLEPKVTIGNVRWLKQESGLLQIVFSPKVLLRGRLPANTSPPTISFRCRNQGVTGDITTSVIPGRTGSPTRILSLTVPEEALKANRLSLNFTVDQPAVQTTKTGLLVPMIPTATLRIPLTLPMRNVRNFVTASLKQSGAARWQDPQKLTAAFPMTLTLHIKPADNTTMDRSAVYRVIPVRGNPILKGSTTLAIPGPGNYTIPLTVQSSPIDNSVPLDRLRYRIQLKIVPHNPPSHLTFVPPFVILKTDALSVPPPIRTRIVAKLQSVTTPSWFDVARGHAAFDARVDFDVQGQVPPGTVISLLSPSSVAEVRITPRTLHTGHQIVTLHVVTPLNPAPRSTTLRFRIIPPPAKGAVSFLASKPFTIKVVAPVPLRLLTATASNRELYVTVADNQETLQLPIRPILQGLEDPRHAGNFAARVSIPDAQCQLLSPNPVQLDRTSTVSLRLSPLSERPFFTDTVIRSKIDFLSDPQTYAVRGSRYDLVITVLAPFKRLAFILAICLSSLLAFVLLLRMFLKLRRLE